MMPWPRMASYDWQLFCVQGSKRATPVHSNLLLRACEALSCVQGSAQMTPVHKNDIDYDYKCGKIM